MWDSVDKDRYVQLLNMKYVTFIFKSVNVNYMLNWSENIFVSMLLQYFIIYIYTANTHIFYKDIYMLMLCNLSCDAESKKTYKKYKISGIINWEMRNFHFLTNLIVTNIEMPFSFIYLSFFTA